MCWLAKLVLRSSIIFETNPDSPPTPNKIDKNNPEFRNVMANMALLGMVVFQVYYQILEDNFTQPNFRIPKNASWKKCCSEKIFKMLVEKKNSSEKSAKC